MVRTGIGTAIADAVVRWAERRAASSAPRVGNPFAAGFPVFQNWNTKKAIAEGYKAHYALYAVSSDLADCIRQTGWVVRRKERKGSSIVESHPLVDLLRSPNATQTWGALTEAWDVYKSMSGNAYGLFTMIGDSLRVWYLRPDRVSIEPDKRGQIAYYKYTIGTAESELYKPEEILHFKFFDPGDDYYGMAPLMAAAKQVDASNAAVSWNANLVGNRARPSGMLAAKVPLEDTQHRAWRDNIKKDMSGESNAGKVILNPFDATFTPFEFTPMELDYLKSLDSYEAAICKAFHVHPEAIGALGATFENKEWAIRAKWEGPVVSRLNEMRAVLNHKFRPLFGTSDPKVAAPGDLYLDYDLTGTPLADYQQSKALERVTKAWDCGMPWNQAAEEFGLGTDPVPGGDVGYVAINKLPVGSPAPSSEGRSVRAVNPTTEQQMRASWRMTDQKVEGWARGVSAKVSEIFTAQRVKCVKAAESGQIDLDPVIDAERQAWVDLLTAVMRAVIDDFGSEVAQELNPALSEVGRSRMKAIAAISEHRLEGETGTYFDPWNGLTQEWVSEKTAEHVALIQETTKKAIRKAVIAGLDEGESMVQIAKRIKEEFKAYEDGVSSYRAMMIARTEVHAAAGFGMHESARQSGVVDEKHWSDAGNDRVRDAHVANTAAGWISFNETYPNGAMYPGDGTDDIGCRCAELYRTAR